MKKIILTCVMAILSLSFTNAKQDYNDDDDEFAEDEKVQTIFLGFTAGYNQSFYVGDRNSKWKPGAQIGMNCEVFIGNCFSIEPELIFSYKTVGVDNIVPSNIYHYIGYEENLSFRIIKSTDRLWYASVPVNLKISYPFISGRPFIAFAPVLDIGLYGKNKVNDYGELKSVLQDIGVPFDGNKGKIEDYDQLLFQANPNDKAFDFRMKPIYKNINFSFLVKAGIDFSSGLSLSAAYQIGLTNMYEITPHSKQFYKSVGMKLDQKMHTFSASLGYKF